MTGPGGSDETYWRSTERTITFVGAVLSAVVAVVVPLIAISTSRESQVGFGIITFVAGYLVTLDLAQRVGMRKLKAELAEQFTASDARRFGALPMQRLLMVPEIEESILELVDAAATARTKQMPFLANRTVEGIVRQTHVIVENSRGNFKCDSHQQEMRLLRMALQDTKRSMLAVAALGLDAWRTERFRDYFDVFLESAARLEQKRIFLVTEAEFASEEMMQILERHRDAGVETLAIDKAMVWEPAQKPLVLFDDGLLLSHVSRDEPQIEVTFTDDEEKLRVARETFDELYRKAHRPHQPIRLWP